MFEDSVVNQFHEEVLVPVSSADVSVNVLFVGFVEGVVAIIMVVFHDVDFFGYGVVTPMIQGGLRGL